MVSVVVGGRDFDRRGQVEDDRSLLRLVLAVEPGLLDGVAQLDGKVGFGLREGLGRVLELPLGAVAARDRLVDELAHELDVLDGERDRLLLRVAEDLVAEDGRGGVVHVEDDVARVPQRFDRATDEGLARGRENLRAVQLERESLAVVKERWKTWERTWSQTSFGNSSFSMRPRMKVNSVSLAEGKPASISLNPHLMRLLSRRRVCFQFRDSLDGDDK